MRNKLLVTVGLFILLSQTTTVYAKESVIDSNVEWFKKHTVTVSEDKKSEADMDSGEDSKNIASDIFSENSISSFINNRIEAYSTEDTASEVSDDSYTEDYDKVQGEESSDIYSGYSASGYNFSDNEIKIIAQVMHHEAGNQCEAGQIAVVEVILNRLFSQYFPNTVRGVVYQPHQFSYVERSKSIVPTERELNLVKAVILGDKKALADNTIMYYRNPKICINVPAKYVHDWGRLKYVTYVQDHAFYRDVAKFPSDWSSPINVGIPYEEFVEDSPNVTAPSVSDEYIEEYEDTEVITEEYVEDVEEYTEEPEYTESYDECGYFEDGEFVISQ